MFVISLIFSGIFQLFHWLIEDTPRERRWGPLNIKTVGPWLVSLAMLIWSIHEAAVRDSGTALAAYVPPFPDGQFTDNYTVEGPHPSQHWTLETEQTPEQVIAYYQKTAGERGWKFSISYRSTPRILTLQLEAATIFIRIHKQAHSTLVQYTAIPKP